MRFIGIFSLAARFSMKINTITLMLMFPQTGMNNIRKYDPVTLRKFRIPRCSIDKDVCLYKKTAILLIDSRCITEDA